MAGPITWRSIIGPSLADAARPLQQAGDSMNAGFDRLMKTLEGAQTANQTVFDRGQDGQLLSFREALANAKTPEEVAAVQAQRDTMLAGLTPERRAQVLGAEEQRTTAVRKGILDARDFGEKDFLFQNQGVIAQAKALAARGDTAGAMALAGPLMNHAIYGDLVKEAVTGQRAAEKHTDDLANSQSTRNTQEATAAAATQNANTGARNATVNEGQLQLSRLTKAEEHALKLSERLGKEGANTVGGPGGMDAVLGELGKVIKDPGRLNTVTRLAAEALNSNPEFRRLPTDVVVSTILEHSADLGVQGWLPDMGNAGRMANSLKKALTSPAVVAKMSQSDASRERLVEELKLSTPLMDEARRGVFPSTQGQIDAAAARALAPGGMRNESAAVKAAAFTPEEDEREAAYESSPTNLASLERAIKTEKNPATVKILKEELAKQRSVAAARAADPVLPEATVRLTSPADSPAGRFQARLFREQQEAAAKESARESTKQRGQQDLQTKAEEEARRLVRARDFAGMAEFQQSALFSALPRDMKQEIHNQVNSYLR